MALLNPRFYVYSTENHVNLLWNSFQLFLLCYEIKENIETREYIYKEEEDDEQEIQETKLERKGRISYSIVCHKALYLVSIYKHQSTSRVRST